LSDVKLTAAAIQNRSIFEVKPNVGRKGQRSSKGSCVGIEYSATLY